MNAKDLEEALEMGMDWSLREGYVWAEDKVCIKEYKYTKPGRAVPGQKCLYWVVWVLWPLSSRLARQDFSGN